MRDDAGERRTLVHCVHVFSDETETRLRQHLHRRVELTVGEQPERPTEVDVLVAGRPAAEMLDALPRLRAVVVPWAGIGRATAALVAERPRLALHNLHHNAQPTAEHAVALLLAAAKSVLPADAQMRGLDWRDRGRAHRALLLHERRALVVGWGAIGSRIGGMLRGMGMKVAGVRAHPAGGDEGVFALEDLDGLLPMAHAVVLALPLTDETEGLFDAARIARMRPGAVLVNVGRGPVVDAAALYDALANGRLHAAGLDVWWSYPRKGEERTEPAPVPLHELPNVVMSPHRGGHCDRTDELRADALADLLNRLARGDDVRRVDPRRGY